MPQGKPWGPRGGASGGPRGRPRKALAGGGRALQGLGRGVGPYAGCSLGATSRREKYTGPEFGLRGAETSYTAFPDTRIRYKKHTKPCKAKFRTESGFVLYMYLLYKFWITNKVALYHMNNFRPHENPLVSCVYLLDDRKWAPVPYLYLWGTPKIRWYQITKNGPLN